MSKVVEYVGFLHILKDHVKETWTQFWSNVSSNNNETCELGDSQTDDETNIRSRIKVKLNRLRQQSIHAIDKSSTDEEDYSHLNRPKSRKDLMKISAAVMGIEFSYAAETAFVSPLLLNIGLRHRHLTLIWCLSPLLGFFLTPILGSLSDGCRHPLGRRRPFIILLSIGIVLGLILVPNGKTIGRMLGDTYDDDDPLPDAAVPSKNLANLLKARNSSIPLTSTVNPYNFISTLPPEVTLPYNEQPRLLMKPTEFPDGQTKFNVKALPDMDQEPHEMDDIEGITESGGWKKQSDDNSDMEEANNLSTRNTTFRPTNNQNTKNAQVRTRGKYNTTRSKRLEASKQEDLANISERSNFDSENEDAVKSHPWGLVFTVIGTVLLDFDADACQSPSRAYMLDVTIPEDHAKGLSTFTIMAGLGGAIGYFLGALNWETTFLGQLFGGHVRAVFTLVLFIFIACVITTIRSFREIPLDRLWANKPTGGMEATSGHGTGSMSAEHKPKSNPQRQSKNYARLEDELDPTNGQCDDQSAITQQQTSYGAIQETSFNSAVPEQDLPNNDAAGANVEVPSFREYLRTILQLPKSLQWLCATNFFCWMSLVCYSLYFTDFVGEAVFGGDPTAKRGSPLKERYDEGVRFGCWGMSLYSLSCSIYSLCIESLVNRFGARQVYIYGQLVYSVGMVLMAIARHPAGVIIFSWTAGIMYATLFTMPYLLVARYHAAETFDVEVDDMMENKQQVRGLGTDVAIVSSMVFLAQITQALTLGTVVTIVGSTTAIVCAAALFASCGALCARKVLYLDL